MRGLRSTLALVVVLVGLGAYIYFVTWKTAAKAATTEAGEGLRRRSKPTRSRRSKVSSASGDATTLKKDNGGVAARRRRWRPRPTNPKCPASPSRSASIDIVRVVDENPTDLNDYGLSNAADRSRLQGGRRQGLPASCSSATRSPTGADLFAKRNDEKRVFLIPAFQETTFNKYDVRPARQDRAEVRARQGRRRRRRRRRQDAA